MHDPAQRRFTVDDYWAVETSSPLRHEYVHGAIYAMAGGSPRHNEVAANVQFVLRRVLDDTPCRPVGADQRIRVSRGEYTYADVTVYRGRIEVAPENPPDTALNPAVIVEVLSDSTRGYDHGDKCEMYQRIPSARSIWLVEPETTLVTVWTRTDEGWISREYRDIDGSIPVLDRSVSISDLYTRTVT
jgi:Uma2 family endonuclease